MSRDTTREVALLIQRGVKDSKTWQWGALSFSRTEFAVGPAYALQISFCGHFASINWGHRTS